MIVVDTTVWIDFLEARNTRYDRKLQALIEEGTSVGLTDLIYGEILQGIRDDEKFSQIRDILQAFPILRVRGLRTFEHAASIYRACRKRGLTIRSTIDCLIAATCIESGAELYHHDRDFETIAKLHDLRIYRP
ncbi:MAG: PIN domain nuclease [Nitrospirota bacterium]|nr:PIN domain nuclease [Nitrospirota bacterium]MDE3242099.1 PIN domain nuclease [Nitrospirota bacterium]